jgi:microcystin-dependent protein
MSDPFVAEIRIFGFSFAPKGWAFCDGQLLPISQNTALFSLLGTTYGGDGKSTFALPDMQGNAPMQPGQGQGLSQRFLGEMSGVDNVTLLVSEIPFHNHIANTHNFDAGTLQNPGPTVILAKSSQGSAYQTNTGANITQMAPEALAPGGGSVPHNNMQPYLTLNFCIALQGVFPARP